MKTMDNNTRTHARGRPRPTRPPTMGWGTTMGWRPTAGSSTDGSASLVAILTVTALLGVSGTVLLLTGATHKERGSSLDGTKALYAASSGASHAVANMTAGAFAGAGDEAAPVGFSEGGYWFQVATDEDETHYTVRSTGEVRGERRSVEVVVAAETGGVYGNAIFAGNSSNDPLYTLELGGSDAQADRIDGDLYSGGHVELVEDATVGGTIRASGTISGASGQTDASQPIPDLAGMNYAATADVKVLDEFLAGAYYASDDAGGSAYQLAESNPAHIFRVNPSDRASDVSGTEKHDFFLEDPYERVRVDGAQDGSDPYGITLSGLSGEPGPNSNGLVFYIDGNLWLHNKRTYSLGLKHQEALGVQITFVVSGNIYFSDNFFYGDAEHDGVAFIAMKDENVEDSGNIYFGDPVYGTLQHMEAFMYAENNFYDLNLDSSGSAAVEVVGNMTAGNHVLIERDWDDSHTRLHVDFDERIASGALDMPGLPSGSGANGSTFQVVSWRVVGTP